MNIRARAYAENSTEKRLPDAVKRRLRREVILEGLAVGMGVEAIAERLGLSAKHTASLVREAKGEQLPPGSKGKGTLWTSDEDRQLRAMWGRITPRKIGEKIGRTRSMVMGRAFRLGLMKKGDACEIPTLDEEARRNPTLPRLKFLERGAA